MQPGERRRGLRLPFKAGRGGVEKGAPTSAVVGAAVMAVAATEGRAAGGWR
jgi:hypothetical protein